MQKIHKRIAPNHHPAGSQVQIRKGFCESNGAELDPTTMATLKPGTEIVKAMGITGI